MPGCGSSKEASAAGAARGRHRGQKCSWGGGSGSPFALLTGAPSHPTGFITMTPQLFINYKLKSVAHLPWRMLTYKALNTFIDDLFAFVIKMPVMYRIGCLRDGEARWVGGLAGSPPVGSHQSWAWAGPCLREGPWPGRSAHSGQDDSSTRHMLGAGWTLPPFLTPPPRPSPRCGLLHLPLPTVDLPRRPHAGERVWHERRGPNCSCPCGRGPASSRGPLICPQPHHNHRSRQGGGLYTPALPGPSGAQLCQ